MINFIRQPWYEGSFKFICAAASLEPAQKPAPCPRDLLRREVLGIPGTAPVPVSRSTVEAVAGTASAPAGTSTATSLNAIGGACNATFAAINKRHPRFGGPIHLYHRRAQGTSVSVALGTGVRAVGCFGGAAPTNSPVGVAVASGVAAASGASGVAGAGTIAGPVPVRRRFA